MSNNYQKSSLPGYGQLIGEGTLSIPVADSDDALMLNQQQNYAALCDSFVANVVFVQDGKDFTNKAQKFYLNLIQTCVLTLAEAQAYFSGCSAVFWNGPAVIDWKLAYTTIKSTPFHP